MTWLRLPPRARDGKVSVLPTVEPHCSAASVNRKLASLTSFCGFHTRHGAELTGLLAVMQPAGRRGGSATAYKPFLHHVTKSRPGRHRAIKLNTPQMRPKVLTPQQVQAILDACEHLRDRLLFALLLDTGMRKGELLGLTIDAVVQIGSAFWLRTPVGKMHTDRYIPLHPTLKQMLDRWLARRPDWQSSDLLFTDRGRPIPPSRVDKAVQKAATAADLGHIHPHQLRHTLATQAINRGMSLEAIAALLGHRSLSMTMVYARIADRTVADEYFNVTEKVEALYDTHQPAQLPADEEGRQMRKLRSEMHRRMLGNGYCARPVELDCHFESICESCTFFVTTIEFRLTLQAQRDDAHKKGQIRRQQIFDGLLDRLDQTAT